MTSSLREFVISFSIGSKRVAGRTAVKRAGANVNSNSGSGRRKGPSSDKCLFSTMLFLVLSKIHLGREPFVGTLNSVEVQRAHSIKSHSVALIVQQLATRHTGSTIVTTKRPNIVLSSAKKAQKQSSSHNKSAILNIFPGNFQAQKGQEKIGVRPVPTGHKLDSSRIDRTNCYTYA